LSLCLSSGVDAVRAGWEAALGFFYPNVCQICRTEPAGSADGYVGAGCRSAPGAVRWIAAPYCDRCGLPFDGEIQVTFVCENCRELDLQFRYARAAVAAQGLVLDVIHRYKYSRAVWFEPFLVKLLVAKAAPALDPASWDMIVPVPLHSLKQREREFNQAERLARQLGVATGIPVNTRFLKRTIHTPTQTRLSRTERAANVSKAFRFTGREPIKGARIVLFDDVLTTGSTTSACAKILRTNGAADVCVWTVARGL
jgi:competence protein ComFC